MRSIRWEKWSDPIGAAKDGVSEYLGPFLNTPAGLVPLATVRAPSESFDFWIGHADFDLTAPMAERLGSVPGVESLDVVTRYRFRLGCARAFDSAAVRKAVEAAACRAADGPVDALLRCLNSKPYWAVGTGPDGETIPLSGRSQTEVEAKAARAVAAGSEGFTFSWKDGG